MIEQWGDVLEWIADRAGVYGCGEHIYEDSRSDDVHPEDCPCRICFVSEMDTRLRAAMKAEVEPATLWNNLVILTERIERLEAIHDPNIDLIAKATLVKRYSREG